MKTVLFIMLLVFSMNVYSQDDPVRMKILGVCSKLAEEDKFSEWDPFDGLIVLEKYYVTLILSSKYIFYIRETETVEDGEWNLYTTEDDGEYCMIKLVYIEDADRWIVTLFYPYTSIMYLAEAI